MIRAYLVIKESAYFWWHDCIIDQRTLLLLENKMELVIL